MYISIYTQCNAAVLCYCFKFYSTILTEEEDEENNNSTTPSTNQMLTFFVELHLYNVSVWHQSTAAQGILHGGSIGDLCMLYARGWCRCVISHRSLQCNLCKASIRRKMSFISQSTKLALFIPPPLSTSTRINPFHRQNVRPFVIPTTNTIENLINVIGSSYTVSRVVLKKKALRFGVGVGWGVGVEGLLG